MRVVLLCALSVAIIAAQTLAHQAPTQAPARDRPVRSRAAEIPEPTAAKGVIRGTVVAGGLDGGPPLSKVRVELARDGRTTEWMFTDATGSFEFSSLPGGRYTILADKTGYAPAPSTIALADGSDERVEIRMPKGAVIGGRIVDDLGDPVVGARVIVNTILVEGTQRKLQAISRGPADTDDLGAFRVGGLPAGTYLLSVMAADRGAAIANELSDLTSVQLNRRIGLGRTFYPASATSAGAVPIDLEPGEEKLDVDVALAPYRPAMLTVAVSISSAPDPALRGATSPAEAIRLGVDRAVVQSIRQVNVAFAAGDNPELEARGTGVMGFSGLNPNLAPTTVAIDPGTWAVIARRGLEGGIAHAMLAPGEIRSAALAIRPASRFSGQVTFEGSTRRPAPSAVRLDVLGTGPDNGLSPLLLAPGGPFVVKPDGAFAIAGVLGTVEFVVTAPEGWTVSRFSAGERDLLGASTTFEGGEIISNVRVVLTDQVAEINGSVVDVDARPAPGCSVTVFPPERGAGFNRYRMQLAEVDRAGRFFLRALPAGSYTVAAARDVNAASWTAPENLDRLRAIGALVTIGEREKKTLTLVCGGAR